jgi:hypothetical protein
VQKGFFESCPLIFVLLASYFAGQTWDSATIAGELQHMAWQSHRVGGTAQDTLHTNTVQSLLCWQHNSLQPWKCALQSSGTVLQCSRHHGHSRLHSTPAQHILIAQLHSTALL